MNRKYRIGTFKQFKRFTLAVVTGKRQVRRGEPKIWLESHPRRVDPKDRTVDEP
jgi:hypothetical protein